MVEKQRKDLLRKRVSKFFSRRIMHESGVVSLLGRIASCGQRTFLFGGVLRDLMTYGENANPRDLDLVVSELGPDLRELLCPYVSRETRFGGIQAVCGGWELDLWRLDDTWAFRQPKVSPSATFENLPRTTFLNVQAVAVEITDLPKVGEVVEFGFFDAVQNGVLDINFELNPYPLHCLLTAFLAAHELGFALSPPLVHFIAQMSRSASPQSLCELQRHKFGAVKLGRSVLAHWMHAVARHARQQPDRSCRLPQISPSSSCPADA